MADEIINLPQPEVAETITKVDDKSLKVVKTIQVTHNRRVLELKKKFLESQIQKGNEELDKINSYLAQFE